MRRRYGYLRLHPNAVPEADRQPPERRGRRQRRGRSAGERRQAVSGLSAPGLRQRHGGAGAHQHLRQQAGDLIVERHQDRAQGWRRSGRHPRHGRRLRRRCRGAACCARSGTPPRRRADGRAGGPLLAPHHHAAGRPVRSAQDHGVERADHRRRRPRLAHRRVSRAGRHRQDRHRRLRYRRYLELAAPNPAPERRHRQAEGALRERDDQRLQPGRRSGHARSADYVRQFDGDHRPVRLHHQRRGQLRRALSGERHLPLPQEAAHRRLDPAVRWPGDGLPARTGLLPLPLSRAASARHGAELRRGRRAGRAVRHRRHHPGDGGAQADPRRRRFAARPADAVRRAGDGVPAGSHPPRPPLRALR